jgi:hypothetical protein
MAKKNGFFCVVMLMVMGFTLLKLSGLMMMFYDAEQQVANEYGRLKAYYLAYSGLALINNNFEKLSLIKNKVIKDEIYNRLNEGICIKEHLDGEIYLFKNDEEVFSVGLVPGMARAVIRSHYQVINGNIKLYRIQQF